jgi:4-hydroxybutyrate dehydrogenase/sulfolactaldehyde 3-reductase
MQMVKIAFIGLGTMGLPMAHNLIKGGYEVTGFDLQAEALQKHLSAGGKIAKSTAEAVQGANFVFTMLPVGKHVKAVLEGCLEAISSSSLFIEMSTIHPFETDEIRSLLAEKGVSMIDAPVGRTSEHAYTGSLLIMAGGEKADLAKARSVLELLGDPIIDCGGPGMGSRMKIINNFLSNMINVATAEALTLAEVIGLDRNLAIDLMSGTAAGKGHMATTYPNKVLKNDLSPAFMLDLAHKDQGLALDLAKSVHVSTLMGSTTKEVYELAQSKGFGKNDWTSVYAMMREQAGIMD